MRAACSSAAHPRLPPPPEMKPVRTTCPYCGVGCGVKATPGVGRVVTIEGDAAHPANEGRLCSKGTHLGETEGLEGRLLHPDICGKRAGWDKVFKHVACTFARLIMVHVTARVALYDSGQFLPEVCYMSNKR